MKERFGIFYQSAKKHMKKAAEGIAQDYLDKGSAETIDAEPTAKRADAGPDLTRSATEFRGAPRPATAGMDGKVDWGQHERNMIHAVDLVAAGMALCNHLPPAEDATEIRRRALATNLFWHGIDPARPPDRGFFDLLHREPWEG